MQDAIDIDIAATIRYLKGALKEKSALKVKENAGRKPMGKTTELTDDELARQLDSFCQTFGHEEIRFTRQIVNYLGNGLCSLKKENAIKFVLKDFVKDRRLNLNECLIKPKDSSIISTNYFDGGELFGAETISDYVNLLDGGVAKLFFATR